MNGSESLSDDTVTSSRLQQLLILGGLGLFIVALVLVGGFGGLVDLSGSGANPTADDINSGASDTPDPDGTSLAVADLSVPAEVRSGDSFVVTLTVENPGTAAATADLTIDFDGETVHDEPVEVEAGEAMQIESTVDTDDRPEGSYDLHVTLGEEITEATVTLTEDTADERAFFRIVALDAPTEVDHGDPINIEVVVENDGDDGGTADVVIEFGGDEVASDTLNLDAGGSTVFGHEIDSSEYETGSHQLTVMVDDDQASTTVDIVEEEGEAVFEISSLDAPAEVASGESFDIGVTVENSGDERGGTELVVTFDGDEVVTDTIVLDGGESRTVTYQVDTDGLDPDTYDLVVAVEGDEAETSVEVTEEDDATFEIDNFEAPDEVEQGDPIEVNFTVENTGATVGTVEVVTEFADDFEQNQTITLGPGDSAVFSYEIDTDDYEEGEYLLVVTAGEAHIEHEVEIEEGGLL